MASYGAHHLLCVRVIVMLEDPATTHLQCSYWGKEVVGQISRYMAPSILPSIQCSRPVSFAEKHPQSMMFPHPYFMVGMVFLGLYSSFSSSKHGEGSLYQKVIFGLIRTTWPSLMPHLDHSDGLWQTSDGPGHVLAWAGGPCLRCRILIHDGVVCY